MEAWLLFPIRLLSVVMVAALAYFLCEHVQERIVSGTAGSVVTDGKDADSDPSPVRKSIPTTPLIVGMATFIVVLLSVESVYFRRFTFAIDQVEAVGGSVRFDPPYRSPFARYFAKTATVDLSDRLVDDSELPPLWFIPNLKAARLANTRIGATAIRHLLRCRGLESLDLSGTPIDDSDLSPLRRFRQLRSLLLNDTSITDRAVTHLSNFPRLKRLEMAGTQLSDDGYGTLRSAYPDATMVVASIG